MALKYCEQNPIITPNTVAPINCGFEVVGAFNPGVTEFDGKILLLIRIAERVKCVDENCIYASYVECGTLKTLKFDKTDKKFDFSDSRIISGNNMKLLTSFSHLVAATSEDGVNFMLQPDMEILPEGEYERFGIEDSRITKIGGTYYIVYSAISEKGICTALRSTEDFISFKHHGNILCPDNKDSALFPEKISGKYMLLHRPSSSEFARPEMWIAQSDNLVEWGNHKLLMGVRRGRWDCSRIGSSSVPMKTDEGWLIIYHGADYNNRYCLGAALLDLNDPSKVLRRSVEPFMEPVNPYEKNGFFSNVVFACGCIREGDLLKIFYGAADESVCRADIKISDILKTMD